MPAHVRRSEINAEGRFVPLERERNANLFCGWKSQSGLHCGGASQGDGFCRARTWRGSQRPHTLEAALAVPGMTVTGRQISANNRLTSLYCRRRTAKYLQKG